VPAPEAVRLSKHPLPRCDVGRSNKDAHVAAAQHRKRNPRAHGILPSTPPGLLRKRSLSSKMPSPSFAIPPSCYASLYKPSQAHRFRPLLVRLLHRCGPSISSVILSFFGCAASQAAVRSHCDLHRLGASIKNLPRVNLAFKAFV
jgi:hypothetical protein